MYIETDRLIMRNLSIDDTDALLSVLGDPEVMSFVEPPFDYEKTREFI